MRGLHSVLREILEQFEVASSHVLYIDKVATGAEVSSAVEKIDLLLGNRSRRLAVVGSITYNFPPLAYGTHGAAATEQISKSAARAVAAAGHWLHILLGGTWDGPQRTFAEAFAESPGTVVHVLPNCEAAKGDLRKLLVDADGRERKRHGSWRIVFVGRTTVCETLFWPLYARSCSLWLVALEHIQR
eukprot:gnl/TRDRNA2_/TRDRNA2_117370_c0_seq1.p2 gnl/TRDRNA2_/TRDRNA2_117370_c0~~gnl/TRDRNA2_/TRDRNA2_117370_c0_seq1.p2  ORF type:complete len:187 (+),score=20.17 gnl/TRDRNA2_/TRDRNA2_117370_c0_seq1:67-627(+)